MAFFFLFIYGAKIGLLIGSASGLLCCLGFFKVWHKKLFEWFATGEDGKQQLGVINSCSNWKLLMKT